MRRILTAVPLAALLGLAGTAVPAGAQTTAPVPELRAVSCSATGCLAAGDSTVISRAEPDGQWQVRTAPKGAELLAGMACPAARTCQVVGSGSGDNGELWRTTNGGVTWHAQLTAIAGGFFLAVACPSVLVCLATGNEGTIYGTVNGGRTWRQQRVPKSANLIYGIACPSVRTCEAVGYGGSGLALRTENGGRTWTRQRLPASVQNLQAVSCPTAAACLAVGINVIQGGSKEVGSVATTTNGGVTWTSRPGPAGFTDLTGVACPKAGVCQAAGLGPHAVARTTDGGVTWTSQDIPGSVFLEAVTCPTARACEAVGENADDDGVAYGTVNSGRAWKPQPIPRA
jgi:photosystem II stability/assembly factor-like uncharacterized protein